MQTTQEKGGVPTEPPAAALLLAQLVERELGLGDGVINAAALMMLLRSPRFARISALAHAVHGGP